MIEGAALKMRVDLSTRPTGVGSNRLSLLGLRGQVASERKRATEVVLVGARKMSKTKPSLRRREVITRVKTGGLPARRDKLGRYLFTDPSGARRIDGISLVQASVWNVGTCRPDAKGKVQAEETARPIVPMRGTGTEQLVVAVKSPKRDGAKGLCYFRPYSQANYFIGGARG